MRNQILPGNNPDYIKLSARHSQLVDKKFLEGLTEIETVELAQINRALDEVEEGFYAPIKAALAELEKTVLAELEKGK